jgi:hypothetical protein
MSAGGGRKISQGEPTAVDGEPEKTCGFSQELSARDV